MNKHFVLTFVDINVSEYDVIKNEKQNGFSLCAQCSQSHCFMTFQASSMGLFMESLKNARIMVLHGCFSTLIFARSLGRILNTRPS